MAITKEFEGGTPTVRSIGGKNIAIDVEPTNQLSGFERFSHVLGQVMGAQEQQEEKRQKKMKNTLDMYVTLRQAGYDPQAAYEAAQKGELPTTPGGRTVEEKTKEADLSLKQAQTRKADAEAKKADAQAKGTVGKSVFIVNEDGELEKIGEVGEKDKVVKKSGRDKQFTVSELREIIASSKSSPEQKEAAQRMLNRRLGVDPEAAASEAEGTRIRVRRKSDGKTGTILESDFNSSKYEKI